jgi:phosphatidylglycerophosphate synthase
MMYKKRERFSGLSGYIGSFFSRFGIQPNHWSLMVLISAVIAAYLIAQAQFIIGGFFVLLSGFLDIVDGAVARATGKVSKEGAYIDTIVDRYSEFIIILPLFLLSLPPVGFSTNIWIALFLFGSMVTTYAKAAAREKELVQKELRGGILERAERVSLLTLGLWFAAVNPFYLSAILVALAVLSNISALQRISAALKQKE